MSYIIDGHNLIPKVPGLSLQALDDEMELIEQLQEFCRRKQNKVEVFFDRAAPGQARSSKHGRVVAHFVRTGMTADQAIENKLKRLGRAAGNWTVVSSDRAVQAAARYSHAKVLSSEKFASLLVNTNRASPASSSQEEQLTIPDDDVDEWLALFGNGSAEE